MPDDVVARTKARVSVVAVLEKLGARFPWQTSDAWDDETSFYCPFCDDLASRKAAGRANEVKGLWHCFACGSGGDIFNAVRQARGVEFNEALQWVLDEFPEEVTEFDPWAEEGTA
jgi:CHC2 zinc finger